MPLGANIRRYREALGLSQTQLARQAGLQQATVSRLENSKRRNPPGTTLRTLARVLGVSMEVLMDETGT